MRPGNFQIAAFLRSPSTTKKTQANARRTSYARSPRATTRSRLDIRRTIEKKIIDAYRDNQSLAEKGFPEQWPVIPLMQRHPNLPSPLKESDVGEYKSETATILVDARSRVSSADGVRVDPLTFLEAGPRREVRYPTHPRQRLNVAVLVSGGIAPGINAVLSGIVARHLKYREAVLEGNAYDLKVIAYRNGLDGLLRRNTVDLLQVKRHWKSGQQDDKLDQQLKTLRENAGLGGSFVGTSRFEPLLPNRPERLSSWTRSSTS